MADDHDPFNETLVVPEPPPARKRKPAGKGEATAPPRWWGVLCGFVGEHLRTVPPAAGVVWFVLFRNSAESKVRMSIDAIMATSGLSRRHAIRSINQLVDAGLVARLHRGTRNSGSTIYRLLPTSSQHAAGGTLNDDSQHAARGTLQRAARGTLSMREGEPLPAGAVAVAERTP